MTSIFDISDLNPDDMVVWDTPAGSIGVVEETYPSVFTVTASSKYSRNIFYELLAGDLPPGLTLNPTNGDINGIAGYGVTTVYPFTIRAYLIDSDTWVDRDFSITLLNRYSAPIGIVRVDVLGHNKMRLQHFVNAYHNRVDLLHDDYIFRPLDENFGVVESFSMYILGGIAHTTPQTLYEALQGGLPVSPTDPIYPAQTHFGKLETVFGDVRWATARSPTGEPLYDVLYLDVYDPDAAAGGFNGLTTVPVMRQPDTAINPRPNRIYPTSINNWRKELLNTVPLVGEERMPIWMKSEQTLGVASSVIGFIPAIEIMYVKHGYGKEIVQSLIFSQNEIKFTDNIFDRLTYTNMADPNTPTTRWFSFPPGHLK